MAHAITRADALIRLWDLGSGDQIGVLKGHTGPVFGVAFSLDGSSLASTGRDGSIRPHPVDLSPVDLTHLGRPFTRRRALSRPTRSEIPNGTPDGHA